MVKEAHTDGLGEATTGGAVPAGWYHHHGPTRWWDGLRFAAWVEIVSRTFLFVGGLLLFFIVGQISDRQTQRNAPLSSTR